MHHYIGAAQREAILSYRYSSVDQSFISRHVLGPYWNWLVTLFPTTIAPNTITLSGLVLVMSNVASLLWLDPTLEHATAARRALFNQNSDLPVVPLLYRFGNPSTGETSTDASLPLWLMYVWAVCLFAYQSLDSIDGKQARRTGMSGPLGELFDHGCDALNTTLECILAMGALGMGRSSLGILIVVSSMANFYLTTWEEYHTHTLFLSAFSGPVEGILIVCALFVLSASTGGPAFFSTGILQLLRVENTPWVRENLAPYNWSIGEVFAVFATLGLVLNAVTAYGNVARYCRENKKSILEPVFGLLPFMVQVAAHVFWLNGNNRMIFEHAPAFVPFIGFWGLAFAYLVGILIVAHVTHASFPYWNVSLLVSILGAVDANLPGGPLVQTSPEATLAVVYAALVFSLALYVYFAVDVIQAITSITGKPCFRVVPSKRE
ncbi:ethanolaminephosphotransferase [Malassezia cuniculi]|uniref:Ethanolaminephosphotransferase n=1 Tax=Malassezia cuniculi TaxID=948313 RepID=A0AAF0ER73_9BASI|nr:ethanolaminephosphotransferase [Malassezia cuniculi]